MTKTTTEAANEILRTFTFNFEYFRKSFTFVYRNMSAVIYRVDENDAKKAKIISKDLVCIEKSYKILNFFKFFVIEKTENIYLIDSDVINYFEQVKKKSDISQQHQEQFDDYFDLKNLDKPHDFYVEVQSGRFFNLRNLFSKNRLQFGIIYNREKIHSMTLKELKEVGKISTEGNRVIISNNNNNELITTVTITHPKTVEMFKKLINQ